VGEIQCNANVYGRQALPGIRQHPAGVRSGATASTCLLVPNEELGKRLGAAPNASKRFLPFRSTLFTNISNHLVCYLEAPRLLAWSPLVAWKTRYFRRHNLRSGKNH
jgi:hypothetical protein